MKIEPMRNIPSSRRELERHLFLLGEKIKAGKFLIAPGVTQTMGGLLRLRKLPNGRVDLLSLDEMTRLNANMMANMEQQISQVTNNVDEDATMESDN